MPPEKLQKLKQLLEIVNQDTMSNADFLKAFEKVMQIFVGMKTANEQQRAEMLKTFKEKMSEFGLNIQSEMSSAKKETMKSCMDMMEKMMSEHDTKMQEIDSKMEEVNDSKDADEEKVKSDILQEVLPLIPKIEDIEKDLPKLGESIRDSLELIQGEKEKLSISAIGYLREEIDELKKQLANKSYNTAVGGGFRITSIAQFIIPISGTIDDSNVTFTSFKEPTLLIINGGSYGKTLGSITWTYISGTITLSSPVGSGGSIYGIK